MFTRIEEIVLVLATSHIYENAMSERAHQAEKRFSAAAEILHFAIRRTRRSRWSLIGHPTVCTKAEEVSV